MEHTKWVGVEGGAEGKIDLHRKRGGHERVAQQQGGVFHAQLPFPEMVASSPQCSRTFTLASTSLSGLG